MIFLWLIKISVFVAFSVEKPAALNLKTKTKSFLFPFVLIKFFYALLVENDVTLGPLNYVPTGQNPKKLR